MTENTSLNGPEIAPLSGEKPKYLVMFLHGVGADGDDLISLANIFAQILPDAHFVSPNAPFPCDMAPFGYQWFSLLDRSEQALLKGVKKAEPILNRYIDAKLSELSLDDDKLIIIGFSQGTMTALHTMLRRDKPCAAIIGFSGALLAGDLLKEEIKAEPPICLIHGNMDEIVPIEALYNARQALDNAGITDYEAHEIDNLGHGIDERGISIAIDFLKKYVCD